MRKKFDEYFKRSLVKAMTYRGMILISDAIIIFTVTHRYDLTLAVIVSSNFMSTILYIIHERIWNKIHWGKAPHTEYKK